jgi:hypothetical protein
MAESALIAALAAIIGVIAGIQLVIYACRNGVAGGPDRR